MTPNHALQRTRPSRRSCNRRVLRAGSLSLGRSTRWPRPSWFLATSRIASMKIRKKANRDFEVDRFRFRFRGPIDGVAEKLRGLFSAWMRQREVDGTCACFVKHLTVEDPKDPKYVDVFCGWYCDRCLPQLEAAIATTLPDVVGVSVGHDRSPHPTPDLRFILLSDATAFFEDGSSLLLLPYEISRSPVTTGQFDAFTAATGYVTDCERHGDGSFRFDETIEPIRPKSRGNIPVHSVSFNDAMAYCEWAAVRLPTEGELLAAALIDHRVMSRREAGDFMFGQSGRFDITRYPNALDGLGAEFVIGKAAPGNVIVRTGPYYVREVGWETRRHRHECASDAYDIMTGFRVCRQPRVTTEP